MEKVEFDVRLSATRQGLDPVGVGPLSCPACGRPMRLHRHRHDRGMQRRLLASCKRGLCGAWYVVIVRPRERIAHLVRMPAEAELLGAIERRRGEDPDFTRDGS